MSWDKHKKVTVLNRLMGSQSYPSDCIFLDFLKINKQEEFKYKVFVNQTFKELKYKQRLF